MAAGPEGISPTGRHKASEETSQFLTVFFDPNRKTHTLAWKIYVPLSGSEEAYPRWIAWLDAYAGNVLKERIEE